MVQRLALRISTVILSSALLVSAFIVVTAQESNISFPVPELGNCTSKEECKAYCDDPAHHTECIEFAERNGLMDRGQAERARKATQVDLGPGGCRGFKACDDYCSDMNNIEECVTFAQEHDLMDDHNIEEARKMARAVKSGAKLPGDCRNRHECEAYCEDLSNMNECIEFAEAAGFMSDAELEEARRHAKAFGKGVRSPGDCRSRRECDAFCDKPENLQECIQFAEQAGIISGDEADDARRVAPLLARGEGPGGCREQSACEVYCSVEENRLECMEFAVKAGIISEQEAELFRRTGGKGPGGCQGPDECEAFCSQEGNQEACFEFGKQHGLVDERRIDEIEHEAGRFHEEFDRAPEFVRECIKNRIGSERYEAIRHGALPDGSVGDALKRCFDEFKPEDDFGPHPDDLEFEGEFNGEFQPDGSFNRPPHDEFDDRDDFYEDPYGDFNREEEYFGPDPDFQTGSGSFNPEFGDDVDPRLIEEYKRRLEFRDTGGDVYYPGPDYEGRPDIYYPDQDSTTEYRPDIHFDDPQPDPYRSDINYNDPYPVPPTHGTDSHDPAVSGVYDGPTDEELRREQELRQLEEQRRIEEQKWLEEQKRREYEEQKQREYEEQKRIEDSTTGSVPPATHQDPYEQPHNEPYQEPYQDPYQDPYHDQQNHTETQKYPPPSDGTHTSGGEDYPEKHNQPPPSY